jgi:hypothetical protein
MKRIFGNYSSLKKHIISEHEKDYWTLKSLYRNRLMQCLLYECGVEMHGKDALARHYKRVHQFPADECEALVANDRHVIPRMCAYCDQSDGFRTTTDYWRHVVNEHPARHRAAPKSITEDSLRKVLQCDYL